MLIAGSNMRLGWLMLAAVAWAYLGLLVALGMGEGPKGERLLQLGLKRPDVIVLPGRLLTLAEREHGLDLTLALPPDGATPQLPGALPDDVRVKFSAAPEQPRRPRIALSGGHGPFRMPTGGQGVIAGGYLIRINQHDVHLGAIPAGMRERLKRGGRFDGPPEGERREGLPDSGRQPRRDGQPPRRDEGSPPRAGERGGNQRPPEGQLPPQDDRREGKPPHKNDSPPQNREPQGR